jgi:hypothetical protein
MKKQKYEIRWKCNTELLIYLWIESSFFLRGCGQPANCGISTPRFASCRTCRNKQRYLPEEMKKGTLSINERHPTIGALQISTDFRFISFLYNSLCDHRIGHSNKSCDVGTYHQVSGMAILLCSFYTVPINVCHDFAQFGIHFFKCP